MTRRWLLIACTTLGVTAVAVALVLAAQSRQSSALASRERAALDDLARRRASGGADTLPAEPESEPAAAAVEDGALLVVSHVPGDTYGTVTIVHDDGTRTELDRKCDRMHAGGGVLLCMRSSGPLDQVGIAETFAIDRIDSDPLAVLGVGLPSRARVASDGSSVAMTSFVTGHSYLDVGQFATETLIFAPELDGPLVRAEDLHIDSPAPRFDAIDGNWWGVTMTRGDASDAYLTYGSGSGAEILRLDVETGVATPLLPVGGCPSVSPNGRHIVYKRPVPGADAPVSLVLHDVETGAERVLDEERFVDDQVEWLDDDTIAYAIVREDTPALQPVSDVWSLGIWPGATPDVLVPYASSPARYLDDRMEPPRRP